MNTPSELIRGKENALTMLPWLAVASFVVGLLLANIGLPEYSHLMHPVGLRGATGLPYAMAFNLLLFVVPGVLLAVAGQGLRRGLPDAGWLARIGIVLVQLSAFAFAMQGVMSLDPADMDATMSRLHALAWMLWWIAFVPGALLLALGARRGATFALVSLAAAVLVPIIAVFAPVELWVGVAQRLAYALWFGWWVFAASRLSRVSPSVQGSSPTTGR
ncbi:DUF998 domain-containing protein [Thermomonas sp.]|uniref:DUF998 domain-containing protein n=1 Tax=Thermomonas sp. TaxID=1971895 RepID=UPI00248A0C43|nr:DUF998 domain-containing protein [Thermomonas sp.]MDI1252069.1 DUF998 domain-containing protein [Thermomonas sp.]